MAGPCVEIFVPRRITSSDELEVRGMIDAIASTVQGNDFWIAKRPFSIRFGEPEPEDRALVVGGRSPEAAVSLCAMTNTQSDHVLLGMLCFRIAQLLDGSIALDDISMLTQDPSVLTFDGTRPVAGRGYVVGPDFLAYWMGHPEFRLVK